MKNGKKHSMQKSMEKQYLVMVLPGVVISYADGISVFFYKLEWNDAGKTICGFKKLYRFDKRCRFSGSMVVYHKVYNLEYHNPKCFGAYICGCIG